MFLGRWEIDNLLTFTVNTHTPSTGAGTDADAVPSYRVYEDETGTAILTGNMAKLDDANTVGFYSEQITLSAANGFEVGKSYTVYVAAVVGGVTGTLSHSFQVGVALATAASIAALNNLSAAAVWAYATRTLTQTAASVVAAVTGTSITVYRGTTWSISLTGLGDLSAYDTIYFSVKEGLNDSDDNAILRVKNAASGLERINKAAPTAATNGTITVDDAAAGDITITVQEAETQNMPLITNYHYDVKGIDNNGNVDLKSVGVNKFTISGDVTRKIT